jgi:quinol monooxygenase YgiN
MKNFLLGILILALMGSFTGKTENIEIDPDCKHEKESMKVVMRFEIKVMPDKVALLKESFATCKVDVLAKESGCLEYSLFQSYTDSTLFCITEAWATKADHNKHMELEHTKKHLAETRGIHDASFKSNSNYVYWICPCVNDQD